MFRVLIEVATNGAFNLKLSICLMFIFLKCLLVNVYWLLFLPPVGYDMPEIRFRPYPGGNFLPEIPFRPYPGGNILPEIRGRLYPGGNILPEIRGRLYPTGG